MSRPNPAPSSCGPLPVSKSTNWSGVRKRKPRGRERVLDHVHGPQIASRKAASTSASGALATKPSRIACVRSPSDDARHGEIPQPGRESGCHGSAGGMIILLFPQRHGAVAMQLLSCAADIPRFGGITGRRRARPRAFGNRRGRMPLAFPGRVRYTLTQRPTGDWMTRACELRWPSSNEGEGGGGGDPASPATAAGQGGFPPAKRRAPRPGTGKVPGRASPRDASP